MAVRQGFEPWRRSPAYTLSRRAPSTTRPPHHHFVHPAVEGRTDCRERHMPLAAGFGSNSFRRAGVERPLRSGAHYSQNALPFNCKITSFSIGLKARFGTVLSIRHCLSALRLVMTQAAGRLGAAVPVLPMVPGHDSISIAHDRLRRLCHRGDVRGHRCDAVDWRFCLCVHPFR